MPKFRVTATQMTYLEIEVEADNAQEALEIGRNTDGGDFQETGLGDWTVNGAFEVTL